MRTSLRVVFSVFLLCAICHRASGQIPDKGYHAISYNATVKLDRQADSMWGIVTMTGRASESLPDILQHALYIFVDSVFVNGSKATIAPVLDSGAMWGAYSVQPTSAIDSGVLFTLTTYYHGKGMPEQQGTMHWGGVTDEDTMMFAMGVGFNAPYTSCTRHWMPCYDLPDDKPDSVDLTFICRLGDAVASNGLLVGDTFRVSGRTMHWHISHPIATYLLTFATGPYTEFNVSNTLNKPFEVYCLHRDSVKAATEMNGRVAQILSFYDSLFAPYPFEKVGYVVTPFGSMEHQTMISLDKRILTGNPATDVSSNGTVAVHELSHMWWGDWVTCKTFDDAWLNEGFATFCESLALERLFGRSKYLNRQHGNIAEVESDTSKLPLFGAPTVDNHTNNYPSTIYQKGASVLGMLRQYLGDSIFFDAVRYYGNAHAYSTATSADLEAAFKHVSGKDLSWFWREWVYAIGYPKDTIVWYKRPTGAPIEFHQVFNNAGRPYFRVPIPVRGYISGTPKDVIVWMDSTQKSLDFANFGFMPDSIKIDPDGLLLITTARTTFSADVSIPIHAHSDKPTLQVFPNPDHHTQVAYALNRCCGGFDTKFMLIDASGRVVREWINSSRDCCIQGSADLSGLTAGNYRLVAVYPGDSISTTISFTP